MKVVLSPAPGAVMQGKTKEGKMVDIVEVDVQPFFPSARSQGIVARAVSVTARGDEVDAFSLIASGISGKVTRDSGNRGAGTVPLIDREPARPAGEKS